MLMLLLLLSLLSSSVFASDEVDIVFHLVWLDALEYNGPSVNDVLSLDADPFSLSEVVVPPGRVHETPSGTIVRFTETPNGIVIEPIGKSITPRHHVAEPKVLWPFLMGIAALWVAGFIYARKQIKEKRKCQAQQ